MNPLEYLKDASKLPQRKPIVKFTEVELTIRKLKFLGLEYLERERGYGKGLLTLYDKDWRGLIRFMSIKGYKLYDSHVEQVYLEYKFKRKSFNDLKKTDKAIYRRIKMFTEFVETGGMLGPTHRSQPSIKLKGEIGKSITSFIIYSQVELRRAYDTLRQYKRTLIEFYTFCKERQIDKIKSIDLSLVIDYLLQLKAISKSNMTIRVSTLKVYSKYLFDKGEIPIDISRKIPRYRQVRQPKVPFVYSPEEIKVLLHTVDRSTKQGKRNYAILMLAVTLGLRASDIARLKFENINWQNYEITVLQVKTGKELKLPLLPAVGNAIIDYLKFGRAVSKEPYIFLSARAPFYPFTSSNAITHIVQRAFNKSKIKIGNRKYGAHSLRHSLSSNLLKQGTELPIISEVLGHQNTESTKYYLRIDFTSLLQCAIDVPIVSEDFYLQKNGKFYG